MSRFLRFTVEESLRGNASQLKEIVIGTKVFDRKADYDPRLDPIVRVEARRLRRKLTAYYEGPGRQDPVCIEFPVGSYSPAFRTARSTGGGGARGEGSATVGCSVAVIPFLSLDAGLEADYFSDGLSEELIHALTQIQGLGVLAWQSAAQLREHREDAHLIRERTGATFVLRGGVRRTGQRLRITAQLVQTSDSHVVWSEAFDRQIDDVFAIQKEIATAIAAALNLRLRERVNEWPGVTGLRNIEAYQLYLKGRHYARQRTMEGLWKSQVLFEEAIAIDSSSVLAYSGLADTYALIAEYGYGDGCDCMVKAKQAARRALELDPLSAEAHASLGLILTSYDWNWREAGEAFERSLELNPGYATAHFWYGGDHLAMLGRLDQAEREVDTAIRLDPLSPIVLLGRGFLTMFRRDFGRAAREFEAIAESYPSFFRAYASLGRVLILSGEPERAVQVLRRARELAGDIASVLGALGQALALSGKVPEARHLLHEMKQTVDHRSGPCASLAMVHLGLGECEFALDWLERGVERHQSSMTGLKVHPVYDQLRERPRFQELLRKVGLSADAS